MEITMTYRPLGRSGLKVSAIGLGTNQFGGKVDQETAQAILSAALDAGVNFFDTADIYQQGRSEDFIGQALAGRRSQAILATKVRFNVGSNPNDEGASRQHILDGVENSLRRLRTDYIDLYQIHGWDAATPVEETLRALEDLLRMGKVRYIGASNFSAWQLTWANALAELRGWTKFVSIQPHYHLLERQVETELIPACEFFGIGILPYFPLAGGLLTGKYKLDYIPPGSRGESSQYVRKYLTAETFAILAKLEAFAQERQRTLNDLAHAWLLAQPQVSSVISGATRPEHVQANAAAVNWKMTPDELSAIRTILDAKPGA